MVLEAWGFAGIGRGTRYERYIDGLILGSGPVVLKVGWSAGIGCGTRYERYVVVVVVGSGPVVLVPVSGPVIVGESLRSSELKLGEENSGVAGGRLNGSGQGSLLRGHCC